MGSNSELVKELNSNVSKRLAEHVAKAFHESYENLAPKFNYETRKASAVAWDDVPENNKQLMIAVVESLINDGIIRV